jgi:hypothetical protein
MPYYLHTVDNPPIWRDGLRWVMLQNFDRAGVPPFNNPDPSVCLPFPDAKTANARRLALIRQAKKDGSGVDWAPVVFIPSYKESCDWRDREDHRLSGKLPPEYDKDGKQIMYVAVPWKGDDWYSNDGRDGDENSTTWQSMHYAHMSRVMPGQVAFTPTEEYGVQNRKIRMTVARYLDKFARFHNGDLALTTKEIARYVAIVKAHADQQLKIARAGADIVKVYLNGPSSCMSHAVGDYETGGVHPVSAYGDSDLGVAYLGDPATGVSARSIVWPDKKIYIRIYGDDTLRLVLEENGYKNDSLAGATFPAIRLTGGRYLFPYIDTCRRDDGMTADLITKANGKQYFKLKPSGGEYDVKVTEGIAVVAEEDHTCSNCGDHVNGDDYNEDTGLCNSCYQDHWHCERCGEDYYNDDDRYSSEDGDNYCHTCYDKLFARCKSCQSEYRRDDDRASKRDRGVSDYCAECSDDQMICDTCGDMVDNDPVETTCDDCRETEEETAEKETETV